MHKVRHCFVAITPNFEALARQWLDQNHQNEQPQQQSQSDTPVSSGPSNSSAPGKVERRRATVGSSFLFSVDGNIREFGNDYLPPPPSVRPFLRIGRMHGSDFQASAENVDNIDAADPENDDNVDDNHFNSNVADDDEANDVETTENANTNSNNIDDVDSSGSLDATKSLNAIETKDTIESIESANENDVVTAEPSNSFDAMDTSEATETESTASTASSQSAWIAKPSSYVDPFRRSAGGFALYGRRRSRDSSLKMI